MAALLFDTYYAQSEHDENEEEDADDDDTPGRER